MCVTLLVFVCVTLHTVYTWVLARVYGQAPSEELWLIMWRSIVPLVYYWRNPSTFLTVAFVYRCILNRSSVGGKGQWVEELALTQGFWWQLLDNILCSVCLAMSVQLPTVQIYSRLSTDVFSTCCDKWNPFYVVSLLQLRAVSWKKRTGLMISRNKDICTVFLQYSGLCSVCFRHGTAGPECLMEDLKSRKSPESIWTPVPDEVVPKTRYRMRNDIYNSRECFMSSNANLQWKSL